MSNRNVSEETIRNFHLFWDNFPFPVMLLHKDRTIIDRNTAGEAVGYIPGSRCADMGSSEDHKVCQANRALSEQAGKRLVGYVPAAKAVFDSYWIPLAGSDELYVHFFTDITAYAAGHLFPASYEDSAGCSSCSCG